MTASSAFRPCAVVPTYDNPATVEATVRELVQQGLSVVLVDDGSASPGAIACRAAAERPGVTLVRRERNGGKGAAVRDGFAVAARLEYTHAFQIDADGQHDLARIPAFLEAAAANPEALVLGYPTYGGEAPRSRRFARGFTTFWVSLETARRAKVRDAMIGFRVYPLRAARSVRVRGERMQFDVEILVKLIRAGVPVVNLPVGVRYLSAAEGGVSHFRMLRDNWDFSCMHARLCTKGALDWMLARLTGRNHPSRGARP